jgi:hypothetical protein
MEKNSLPNPSEHFKNTTTTTCMEVLIGEQINNNNMKFLKIVVENK